MKLFLSAVTASAIAFLFAVTMFSSGCSISSRTPSGSEPAASGEAEIQGTGIGQIAPEFELERTEGGKISLKDLAEKPVVLVFWTAWCPSCKEEAPHINKLQAEFSNKGVQVVGINIGESDGRIREGIEDFGIRYTVAKDTDAAVSKRYKVVGTPTVAILDRESRVAYFGNELPTDYAARLDRILGG